MTSAFRLQPEDAARYSTLRMRMLTGAPWAFSASPEDDRGLDVAHLETALAKPEYAIFAVEAGPALVAAAGVMRSPRLKHQHRASIWGVWVDVTHRGRGYGKAVVREALRLAWSWEGVDFVDLGVSANSPGAHELYRTHGFVEWGREPESTEVDGGRYDEIMMTRPTPTHPELLFREALLMVAGATPVGERVEDELRARLLYPLDRLVTTLFAAPDVAMDGLMEAEIRRLGPREIEIRGVATMLPAGSRPLRMLAKVDVDGWLVGAEVSLGGRDARFG